MLILRAFHLVKRYRSGFRAPKWYLFNNSGTRAAVSRRNGIVASKDKLHEGVPSSDAIGRRWAKADFPLAHALSGGQFGGIVVHREFGKVRDWEQAL